MTVRLVRASHALHLDVPTMSVGSKHASVLQGISRRFGPILFSLAGLTACSGGGEDMPPVPTPAPIQNTTPNIPPTNTQPNPQPNPLASVPTSAPLIVELGPISGGTIQLQTQSGKNLASLSSTSDGSLNYNPQAILMALGSEEWIVATISGGQDTDVEDDGVIDASPTPIFGSFRVLLHGSMIQSGKKIYLGPRAGLVSEEILARNNLTLSLDALDQMTRQTGVGDDNDDGLISYIDLLSKPTSKVADISAVTPLSSTYIHSIHTDDTAQKTRALSNVAKMQNHLLLSIISDPNGTHLPALQIKSISGGNIKFSYNPDWSNTQVASGSVVIPTQENTVLYYREEFTMNGVTTLGKVGVFDLSHDWVTLAQSNIPYDANGKVTTQTENGNYKNTSYTITTTSNEINPGFVYPKYLSCQVGSNTSTGCQYGPYPVWSPTHEIQVRALIMNAIQSYIDTLIKEPTTPIGKPTPDITTPTPPVVTGTPGATPGTSTPITTTPVNLIDIYRDAISYGGQTYTIRNTWTKSSTNTRTTPITVTVDISRKDGTTYTSNRSVTDSFILATIDTELETAAKNYIDTDPLNKPTPKTLYTQNQMVYGVKYDYLGGWYEVDQQWNINGTSDYPMRIIGTYGLPNGTRGTNIEQIVSSVSDLQSQMDRITTAIRSEITTVVNILPKPTYPQGYLIPSDPVSYRGQSYTLRTTMNVNGNSDYPATVYVSYTTPSGGGVTQTITANSASELANIQAERINDARARIDIAVDADQYPAGATETITNTTNYGGGNYRTVFTYSLNPGQDYPGYIDIYITYSNGQSNKLTIQIDNANQKYTYATNIEAQARQQLDNYPLQPINTITSDGPKTYGSQGSNYTYKVKYNRTNTNTNYPALVWIEYHSGGGVYLDTRTTYGNLIANNWQEKEDMKATLANWVKTQMIAQADDNAAKLALYNRSRIMRYLPMGEAVAAATNPFSISTTATRLAHILSGDTSVVTWLGASGRQVQTYMKSLGKDGTVASNSDVNVIQLYNLRIARGLYNKINSELKKKMFLIQNICNQVGSTNTQNGSLVGRCTEYQNIDYPILPVASSQTSDIKMKIADYLFGNNGSNQMNEFLSELLRYNKNFLIMYAIIFEEQAHLMPPYIEDDIMGLITDNDTVGLSQIRVKPSQQDKAAFGYTDSSREDLLNPKIHLAIMNTRIEKIRAALIKLGKPQTIGNIARAWNGGINCINDSGLCSDHAIDYGNRVQEYAQSLQIYYSIKK